ncbi:MAG TPA: hypothetical protein VLX91_13265 [Candidatus Acidoferrales bacterium]|nr:hypothetical protein [Candidatus Acidoferrales bacterium]
MIEIKGSVVNDTINSVKKHYGQEAYNTVVGLLKGVAREVFEKGPIAPTSWYPLDAFVEFLELDLKVTANGNEEELIKRSEVLFEQELTGIYRAFLKLGTPEFVLRVISTVNRTYFRGLAIEASLPAAGKAVLKYIGFERRHRLVGLSIIGFYRKALSISGAKDIKAEFTTPIEDDKGYCELVLSWTAK